MRKLFTLLMLLLSTFYLKAQSFSLNGLTYSTTGPTEVDVCSGSAVSGVLTIPDSVTYNGIRYVVTGVREMAFAYDESIVKVIIGNSVTKIGRQAFGRPVGDGSLRRERT